MRLIRHLLTGHRGQVLPIMALLLVAFIGLIGLAIDLGRLYVAKAELSRAVDSAALAGVVDLPDQAAAQARANAYLNTNQPDASATFPPTSQDYQIRVKGTRSVDMNFMSIFGFGQVDIDATAAAGFGQIAVDAVLALDSTGSMGDSPCNGAMNNPGCPIKEAKDASVFFADILLGSAAVQGDTLVGVTPYRGCYNPPRTASTCVPTSWLIELTSDEALIQSKIQAVDGTGGSGTNVCLGLWKSNEYVFGPNAHTTADTRSYVVVLSDGDNTYNAGQSFGNGEPPMACRPNTSPQNSDSNTGSGCANAQTRERELDVKTLAMADAMEAAGVEVYVVGFGVCGSSSSAACDTSIVGGGTHDNTADRNLLKCIATSATGTNDHYIEVPSASDLPAIFGQIARQIAFRLIE